ncbi:arginase [Denitratisoma sp. agr-D3]
MRPIDLIPVPSALGAPDAGAAQGPAALRRAGLHTALTQAGLTATWQAPVTPPALATGHDAAQRWAALETLWSALAQRVDASLEQGHQPLVVGGDHAIAFATWRAVAARLATPMGLLWIDAHLDAHTPEDSASGNPHGMPLALLLGDGPAGTAGPVLNPAHVCLIGARSWELPEQVRLRRYGVRVVDQEEIRQRGLGPVLQEALAIVRQGTGGFGLSIDLDVFDPTVAPGVNSPVPGGQPADEWLAQLTGLALLPDCLALEIVECDGLRDRQRQDATARLGVALAQALFRREALPSGAAMAG